MKEPEIKALHYICCSKCAKEAVVPVPNIPAGLLLFKFYTKGGWTWDESSGNWYCKKCMPDKFKKDPTRHPHYTDYRDYWDQRSKEECRSHYFEDEDYDPYARSIQGKMCECCRYLKYGYEDDGTSWRMCTVDDPKDHYGHNLYSGHFYGAAISGRLCPYFGCLMYYGRDPEKDKKNGIFHVPYDECYDGD